MNNKGVGIVWSGGLVALIIVGLLFGVTAFAETDKVAVSAVGTSNGVEFRIQDQGIESFQVDIFTPNGKSLFKSGPVRSNSVTWDLSGSSGNRVPFGIYLYQFAGKASTGEIAAKGVAKIFVGPNQVSAEPVGSKSLSFMKGNKGKRNSDSCTAIQSGEIDYSDGHYLDTVSVGYDVFGYNYQAHMFKGSYANAYLGDNGYPPYGRDDEAYYERLVDEGYADTVEEAEELMEEEWYWPNRDIHLKMKWNDAWISNKDCNDDDRLDRHYGHESYIGSGAWLTNDMSGGQGKDKWSSFTKIVAVPESAVNCSEEEVDEKVCEDTGIWYTKDGTEIGPLIWEQFAIVQNVKSGEGATYVSPAGPGLGKWK